MFEGFNSSFLVFVTILLGGFSSDGTALTTLRNGMVTLRILYPSTQTKKRSVHNIYFDFCKDT